MASTSQVSHSPLENVWRQIIPQGHDQALRNAFYNVAAAIFILAAAAAAWSVYLILQPFVQPLMWAVLFGSVLHPVKYRVATIVRKWLFDVKETKTLLSVSVALLPVTSIDNISELVGSFVLNHMRAVVSVTIVLPIIYVVIHYTPSVLSQLIYTLGVFLYGIITGLLNIISYVHILIFILMIIYIGMVVFYWTPENKNIFQRLSLPAWLLTVAAFTCIWPSMSTPLFFLFCILLLGGLYTEAQEHHQRRDSESQGSVFTSVLAICFGSDGDEDHKQQQDHEKSSQKNAEEEEKNLEIDEKGNPAPEGPSEISHLTIKEEPKEEVEDEKPDVEKKSLNVPRPTQLSTPVSSTSADVTDNQTKGKEKSKKEGAASTLYLKGAFMACILMQLWRHSYLIPLLPMAVIYYGIKKATSHHLFGDGVLRGRVNNAYERTSARFDSWLDERRNIIIPIPIRGVFKLLKRIDHKVVSILASSTDAVVTLIVMTVVLLFMILTSIFLAVQIQGEGMQLLVMGSQLINATIVNNPHFHEMLPESFTDVLGSTLDNAYVYGRDWISTMVRSMFGETDEEKAAFLEKQITELWDHIYQAWVAAHPQTPYIGPVVTSEAVATTFDSLIDGIRKTPGLISFSTISDVVRDNIGTVMSVLDSIWAILLSNLSLAMSALTATSSLVLGGSLSILNALLNLVVFLSALFYILSISNDVYKPVAILTDMAPGQMNRLGSAVEESVNGVFKASFKMGAFYGMWTWLLHSVFAINIVYIPAVLGALFGAVPLVGTYWAAIPGVIELFWGHGSPFMALLLFVAQLLPLSCVDTAIYSEIKGGGHPYLTGLAVAGGIFCWGVEGAILGPLVLCILLVATKMYTSLIQIPPNTGDFSKLKKFRRTSTLL